MHACVPICFRPYQIVKQARREIIKKKKKKKKNEITSALLMNVQQSLFIAKISAANTLYPSTTGK